MTQPPANMSAMDGFAVRAADTETVPCKLTVIGESAAGNGFEGIVAAGEAVRIFTGAPLPRGADAIVIQENTEYDGTRVSVKVGVKAGKFVRPAGLDFAEGDVLMRKGRVLTARDVGLAAAMNVPWLRVTRRPRVAVLATGNEVVMPGEPRAQHQIYSSNSVSLEAAVTAMGGEAINLGIARDDEESLHLMAAGAEGADLLVTIGGASVGDYDLVRKVLGKDGMALEFYKVAMRPGKPMIFGHVKGRPVLGLPGNPVSANITAMIFLRAAMGVMLGINGNVRSGSARLGRQLEANDERQDYLRATLSQDEDGLPVATPFDRQDSSMLARLAEADCLVVRPPHAPAARRGETVTIIAFADGLVSL
jgi:molybdopterin molybdotransferase